MKYILFILIVLSITVKGQTINGYQNINNYRLLDMTLPDGLFEYYDYDTSTVWFSDFGFDPDSLLSYPPKEVNVQLGHVCFLNTYQAGIEYPIIEAYKENGYVADITMLNLLNDVPTLEGWVLIRKDPALLISVKLIRELVAKYTE